MKFFRLNKIKNNSFEFVPFDGWFIDLFVDNRSEAAESQVVGPEFNDKKIAADGFRFLTDKFLNRQAEFFG